MIDAKRGILWAAALLLLAGGGVLLLSPAPDAAEASSPTVTVYKSSSCGCCAVWAEHMEEAGFDVEVVDDPDLAAVKAEHRVPTALHACHTATVGGYTIEGHVPAADVRRLLDERPDVAGIGVAGMPSGSPGMPGPPERYEVFTFSPEGVDSVWARH